jgi:very-short-patch-repair endonuclease
VSALGDCPHGLDPKQCAWCTPPEPGRDILDLGRPVKRPDEWETGDQPMTPYQAGYLRYLCKRLGEEFNPNLTKAEASKRIEKLEWRLVEELKKACRSDIERDWLDFIRDHQLRIPQRVHTVVKECGAEPDFLYENPQAAVYVDGPAQDYPERQERDAAKQRCLNALGYLVIRFGRKNEWNRLTGRYPSVFKRRGPGTGRERI